MSLWWVKLKNLLSSSGNKNSDYWIDIFPVFHLAAATEEDGVIWFWSVGVSVAQVCHSWRPINQAVIAPLATFCTWLQGLIDDRDSIIIQRLFFSKKRLLWFISQFGVHRFWCCCSHHIVYFLFTNHEYRFLLSPLISAHLILFMPVSGPFLVQRQGHNLSWIPVPLWLCVSKT